MGVDYNTTVGFGIYLDDMYSMAKKILERTGDLDSDEYETIEDYLKRTYQSQEILESEIWNLKLNCDIRGYGNTYSDDDGSVLMMKYTPENILSKPTDEEIQEFIDCCDKLGLKIVAEDIKFIDEIHIW